MHSHLEHLYARRNGESAGSRQCISTPLRTAGTSPTSGLGFLEELQGKLDELKFGKIASVAGRYCADRDNNWDREERRTICSLWAKACAEGSAATPRKRLMRRA
ncbi:MAG: hypothetical protein ACLRSW_02735 [Christensenellaceae bacterium]